MGSVKGRGSASGRLKAGWALIAGVVLLQLAPGCGATARKGGGPAPEMAGGAGFGPGGDTGVGPGKGGTTGFPVGGGSGGSFPPTDGGVPTYGGEVPTYGGEPPVGGVPNYGGVPNFGGVPDYGGAPPYGGVPDYGGVPNYGGYGGEPNPTGELDCPSCFLLAQGDDLRAVAVAGTKAFWIDHGRVDALGNHQGDGRLLALDLNGGQEQLLAGSLEGPIELVLSAQYAYAVLDESSAPQGKGAFVRIPLSGGAAQVLQSFVNPYFRLSGAFAPAAGEVFWLKGGEIYRAPETAQTAFTLAYDALDVSEIFGDGELLYSYDDYGVVNTYPPAGTGPALLQALGVNSFYRDFTVSGGFIYAIEEAYPSSYLSRLPKTGGPMKRVAKITSAFNRLLVLGDRWVWDPPVFTTTQRRRIIQESFSNPTNYHVLLTAEPWGESRTDWAGMALANPGVVFLNEDKLYLVPYVN